MKKTKAQEHDIVKVGDLVYVGGHIEEVEKVLDKETMTVIIRGAKYGSCKLLPPEFQAAWQAAIKKLGL